MVRFRKLQKHGHKFDSLQENLLVEGQEIIRVTYLVG